MRFRNKTLKLLMLAALLLMTGFIIRLAIKQQLALYVHPRYILFTVSMSIIAAVFIADYGVGLFRGLRASKSQIRITRQEVLSIIPVVLVILMILVAPQRALTSSAAQQRGLGEGSVGQNIGVFSSSSLTNYSTNFDSLTFNDWITIFGAGQFADSYIGKQATVSGFVVAAEEYDNNFYVSRFFVTCCAVDATPLGIKIQQKDWHKDYKEDQWVEVRGTIAKSPSGIYDYVIIPDNIRIIEQPRNPYAN